MKILVVAPNVDMGQLRGNAIHLRNIVAHWSEDYEVHVISKTHESDCPDGVDALVDSRPSLPLVPGFVERSMRGLIGTLGLRTEHEYDLVYERHNLFDSGIVAASFGDHSKVLEVNGSPIKEHVLRDNIATVTAKLLRLVERFNFGLADRIICVSPQVAEDLRSQGVPEGKVSIVANGCDPDAFRPITGAKVELGWEEEATHLGFVGGLNEWHGVEKVVEALPLVLGERPNTRLIIVGDGPLRDNLEKRVSELGLEANVDFVGQVSHETVPLYMSAFDIGTILKHPDIPGSPLKLYEYLACGTPVVATADADFDVLDGTDAGEKARYDDPEDIASAIARLLDAGPGTSQKARSLAMDHSWEKVAERVLTAAVGRTPENDPITPTASR